MSQFCTNAQLLIFLDARRVGDMLLQNNTRATEAQILDTSSAAGSTVQTMLRVASEFIVSAATVGQRYTRDILDGIAATNTNSALILQRLTAMLAFGMLVSRRALPPEQVASMAPEFQWAQDTIELFRRGDRILYDVPEMAEAGLPEAVSNTPRPPQPPTWTQTASRFFGCTPTLLNNPPSPFPYPYPYQ